jgi:hypothetical protein
MRLSNDPVPRFCRALFAALMVLAWCGAPAASAQPADDLAELTRKVEAAERGLRRDTFDPAAVVREAGNDPAQLLEWVRGHTFWVPYAGCLRGPRGVLMDRLGSDLDRAVLLAELLRAANGPRVRLARAALAEARAKALAAASRLPPTDRLAAAAAPAATAVGAFQAELNRMAEDVAGQAATLAEALVGALGDAAPAEADAAAAEPWRVLTDHWWLQYERDGKWIDLDPMAAAPGGGEETAEAAATFDVPDFSDAGAAPARATAAAPASGSPLPPEMWHEVILRIVIEQWKDGNTREGVALTRSLRPALLVGHRLVLHHFPLVPPPQQKPGPESTDLAAALQRFKASVATTREWYPMLEVGTAMTGDASVTEAGELNPNPQTDALKGAGKAVAGAAKDVLDAFSPEAPAAPVAAAGVFGAEWIEYAVHAPGVAARTVRRQVFDLLGPAARAAPNAAPAATVNDDQRLDRALALAGTTDILVLGALPSPQFVEAVTLAGIKAHLDLLPEMSRQVDRPMSRPPDPKLIERLNKVSPPQGPLYGLALVRHLWSPHRDRIYLDRPNVLSHHSFVRRDPAAGGAGELGMWEAMDIVVNDVAVMAAPAAGDATSARRLRLEQGVFDTVAETAFAGGAKAESAAATLAAAKERGANWTTVRGPQDPAWKAVALPPEARARIDRDLAEGQTVVVAAARGSAGAAPGDAAVAWWRVDPATGTALGIGHNGWGPSMMERASLQYYLITGSEAVKEIKFLACIITATAMVCSLACAANGDMAGADAYFAIASAAKKGCG